MSYFHIVNQIQVYIVFHKTYKIPVEVVINSTEVHLCMKNHEYKSILQCCIFQNMTQEARSYFNA